MDLDLGRKSILEWAESPADGPAEFTPAENKYRVEAPIGSGGMGEVLLVSDQDLRRQVAMKVIRQDAAIGRDQRLHFIAEAQATSQLEHPGIPPERVCEPLHFSHEKGVIHRDLKPENIMLGDYGEVHVMDWGLARIDQTSSELTEIGSVETARRDVGLDTQHGALKGTLPYMSPEQVRGEEIDRRSDTYAVGCLLYEILTLQIAFDPKDPELLSKKQTGDVPDVRTRNPRRVVPDPLAAICDRALATDPRDRYGTAEELAGALRRWLDGRSDRERRHKEAERLAGQGQEASRHYLKLRDGIAAAENAAEAAAKEYQPYRPVSEKRPLIEARKRVERLKVDLALAFAEAQKLLDGALLQEPDNQRARAELVSIWRDRLADAERRRDQADIAYAKVMIERYADKPLSEEGQLVLRSDPPAEVLLYRFEEIDGVLTPADEKSLGQTPLGPVTLPAGSYLCVLKAQGCRDTRYPVLVEREKTWSGAVRLSTDEEIGKDFIHVPAGPFLYGEGEKTTTKTAPDFAIQQYPVTFAEYLEFLTTLDATEAKERMPQTPGDGPYVKRDEDGNWSVLPILVEGQAREWTLERYGEAFELRCPVIGISYDDAEAYCRWQSATTGKEWRLPTEEEREKAARGVDGRRFAWGDLEDASLGKCRESRAVPAQPEPVGAFPTAASVYGMGDASGGVWDWTSSWEDERRSSRVLRGGSWNTQPIYLRCARRNKTLPRARDTNVCVRCARGL